MCVCDCLHVDHIDSEIEPLNIFEHVCVCVFMWRYLNHWTRPQVTMGDRVPHCQTWWPWQAQGRSLPSGRSLSPCSTSEWTCHGPTVCGATVGATEVGWQEALMRSFDSGSTVPLDASCSHMSNCTITCWMCLGGASASQLPSCPLRPLRIWALCIGK